MEGTMAPAMVEIMAAVTGAADLTGSQAASVAPCAKQN